MDIVNSYFSSLVFSKNSEAEGYTIYAAHVNNALADGKHTVVYLFVPTHLAIHQRARIHELPWKNLQTRSVDSVKKLLPQRWIYESKGMPNIEFFLQQRTEKYSQYFSTPIPGQGKFELLLLHDPKKKTKLQWQAHVYLNFALNTWMCILNYMPEEKNVLTNIVTTLPQDDKDIEFI